MRQNNESYKIVYFEIEITYVKVQLKYVLPGDKNLDLI